MLPPAVKTPERTARHDEKPQVTTDDEQPEVIEDSEELSYTPFDPRAELEAIKQARIEAQQIDDPEERRAFREGVRERIQEYRDSYASQKLEIANCYTYVRTH